MLIKDLNILKNIYKDLNQINEQTYSFENLKNLQKDLDSLLLGLKSIAKETETAAEFVSQQTQTPFEELPQILNEIQIILSKAANQLEFQKIDLDQELSR
jgi:flagellin-like hook-associated protein FlgL